MVRLKDDYTGKGSEAFEKLGERDVKLPSYDYSALKKRTAEDPTWVHFGGGNLFRCMQASQQQNLIEQGLADTGIILAETYDDGLIDGVYNRYDNRTLNVILAGDGSFSLELVNSVTEALYVNANEEAGAEGFARLKEVFEAESLQLASFTVTEKGYNIKDMEGNYFPPVASEISKGPESPQTLMGVVAAMLLARFKANAAPLALLSTDNFSHNGDKLKSSVLEIAKAWEAKGFVNADFIAYINEKVAFPLSMIDRITPQPSPVIAEKLKALGFEDTDIVKTPKFSVSAAFVNTEVTNYLVVEDNFPNGRPELEKAGVIFTTAEKVDEVERMKVCTCLNPLHTAMAITGCLLGATSICAEMNDDDIVALVKKIGYIEGLPVVTDPGIISPKQFIDEVVNDRLPNPYIPDTPQRIAMDTSQKIPIRFGVTLDLYAKSPSLDVQDLKAIPFVLAAWLRYLLAVDDEGNAFERSPDPMLTELEKYTKGLKIGSTEAELVKIKPLLSDKNLFGVNLEEIGLAEKVYNIFTRLAAKQGAVREVLQEVTA